MGEECLPTSPPPLPRLAHACVATWADTAPRTRVVLLEDAGERGCRSHALRTGSSPRENVTRPADVLVEEGDICQLNLQPTS